MMSANARTLRTCARFHENRHHVVICREGLPNRSATTEVVARPTAEGRRPREKGNSHRGLALPGRGDLGGNAAHIIKQSKGAQNRPVPRPFLLPEGPHRSEGEDRQ